MRLHCYILIMFVVWQTLVGCTGTGNIVKIAPGESKLPTPLAAPPKRAPSRADWTTPFEHSNRLETPRYEETMAYLRRLAQATDHVELASFGRSSHGRDMPLVIVNQQGNFTPEASRKSGNAVVLVEACLHAGEVEGKDAGMMLIRDMTVLGQLSALLKNVTLLFIPIFNVDGHERFGPFGRINQNGPKEMGWRTTARNLNLNRDFHKADSVEMRAWLQLFVKWLPDFFVDVHTTDGADYQYAITYGLELHGNLDPGLTTWTQNYLSAVKAKMTDVGFPLSPYVSFKNWHDPRSGLMAGAAGPRYSQGYTAVQNRPGLLVETHMLKDYAVRVEATYKLLRHTLAYVGAHHETLTRLNSEADARASSPKFREVPFPLKYTSTEKSRTIEFLGVEYKAVESDLTGGTWLQYSDTPATFDIEYFDEVVPAVSVQLPEAYIIPPEWPDVIELLELHGVTVKRLTKSTTVNVRSYRFDDVQWKPEQPWHSLPYEGRHLCEYKIDTVEQQRTFPAGSALVDMSQRTSRIIAHLLEPAGPDSLVHWGFFNPIFQRVEYVESYVIEKYAREMLKQNPSLAKEFERAKKEDPQLKDNPNGIRKWFYQRTPYYDSRVNLYPVGLLDNRQTVDGLLQIAK